MTQKGARSDGQASWLEALGAVPHVEVYLWRPSDRADIARVLR
jgi:hypothetical protein